MATKQLNKPEQASGATRRWSEGEWNLIGPLKEGGYSIHSKTEQIAVIPAHDVSPIEARANALAMIRAREMTSCLEHVLTELTADDEGARWPELIRMIRDELAHQPA